MPAYGAGLRERVDLRNGVPPARGLAILYRVTVDGFAVAGMVGETLSWVGLSAGIPLLIVAGLIRLVDGPYTRTPVELVHGTEGMTARWMTADGAYERDLADWEEAHVADEDAFEGYVSDRKPSRMRLESRHPVVRLCTISGLVLVIAGVAGFAASWLPLLSG